MAIPTDDVLVWATDELDELGNPTKAEPPTENQQTGLVRGQPWPRLWHNYVLNNHGEYLKHLIEEPVGTVKITEQGTTAPQDTIQAAAEWGGTWKVSTVTGVGTPAIYLNYFSKLTV